MSIFDNDFSGIKLGQPVVCRIFGGADVEYQGEMRITAFPIKINDTTFLAHRDPLGIGWGISYPSTGCNLSYGYYGELERAITTVKDILSDPESRKSLFETVAQNEDRLRTFDYPNPLNRI